MNVELGIVGVGIIDVVSNIIQEQHYTGKSS